MCHGRCRDLDIVNWHWCLLWDRRIHLHLWRTTAISAVSAVASVFPVGRVWTVMSIPSLVPVMRVSAAALSRMRSAPAVLGRGRTILVGRENTVLGLFKGGGFFFEALLVLFVLLMFMDQVACCYDLEASKENHVDDEMREVALLV